MGPEAHFFDWGMFWQAASAIATTAAVIVALWQTKYVNKKRVSLFTESSFDIVERFKKIVRLITTRQ